MSILFKSGGRSEKMQEHDFRDEKEFEREVFDNYRLLFGSNTVLLGAKKKINKGGRLGETVPDGFLFDWSDKNKPRFYLIEIELAKHSFQRHIFPQITKFFAFYKNESQRLKLSRELYDIIASDNELRDNFKKFIGGPEIFKFVNDVIETSQNILVVIDGNKPEFHEIGEMHEDTWGKLVKCVVVRKYTCEEAEILQVESDVEVPGTGGDKPPSGVTIDRSRYTEEYHTDKAGKKVQQIYRELKDRVLQVNPGSIFNPAQRYISIKIRRNVVVIFFKKSCLRLVVMCPENEIRECITKYEVKAIGPRSQKFWNGECAAVVLDNLYGMDEVINLLRPLIQKQ